MLAGALEKAIMRVPSNGKRAAHILHRGNGEHREGYPCDLCAALAALAAIRSGPAHQNDFPVADHCASTNVDVPGAGGGTAVRSTSRPGPVASHFAQIAGQAINAKAAPVSDPPDPIASETALALCPFCGSGNRSLPVQRHGVTAYVHYTGGGEEIVCRASAVKMLEHGVQPVSDPPTAKGETPEPPGFAEGCECDSCCRLSELQVLFGLQDSCDTADEIAGTISTIYELMQEQIHKSWEAVVPVADPTETER